MYQTYNYLPYLYGTQTIVRYTYLFYRTQLWMIESADNMQNNINKENIIWITNKKIKVVTFYKVSSTFHLCLGSESMLHKKMHRKCHEKTTFLINLHARNNSQVKKTIRSRKISKAELFDRIVTIVKAKTEVELLRLHVHKDICKS